MKALTKALFAVACSVGLTAPAVAQNWPEKPITVIVPFGPGGSTDMTARLVADKLQHELGQSVIVQNRAGAGGNIGAAAVARADPDGYTLLMATSTHVTNKSLYKNLSYDVLDFVPVSQIAYIPNMLVVNKDLPVNNLKEFVDYIKKNRVNYGSSGSGTSQHLSSSLLNNMADGKMVHVPYKGGGAAALGLLSGEIQAYAAPLAEVVSHVEADKVRAIAVTTKDRSDRFPDVPTIGEVLPGYEVALWNGFLAPKGTPSDVVHKISAAVQKVLKDPEMKEKLAEQGSTPVGSTPEEFKKFVVSEVPKWARIVEISGAKVN